MNWKGKTEEELIAAVNRSDALFGELMRRTFVYVAEIRDWVEKQKEKQKEKEKHDTDNSQVSDFTGE